MSNLGLRPSTWQLQLLLGRLEGLVRAGFYREDPSSLTASPRSDSPTFHRTMGTVGGLMVCVKLCCRRVSTMLCRMRWLAALASPPKSGLPHATTAPLSWCRLDIGTALGSSCAAPVLDGSKCTTVGPNVPHTGLGLAWPHLKPDDLEKLKDKLQFKCTLRLTFNGRP